MKDHRKWISVFIAAAMSSAMLTVPASANDGQEYKNVLFSQGFEDVTGDFDEWRMGNAYTVSETQPLQIWGGNSIISDGDLKYMQAKAMDIYPLAVTQKVGKYELSFDIMPNSPTFENGANWEGIVMQFNLGSSNADSWHDMKIGNSSGKAQTEEANIDTFWLFGNAMTIDPEQWINVDIIYDCTSGTITASAAQGSESVSGTAGFTNSTASVTGSPKVTFEALTVNSVRYDGVYLDNVIISDIASAPTADQDGYYYKDDFEAEDADTWAAEYKSNTEGVYGKATYAWNISFYIENNENNCLLMQSGDMFPFNSTPKTGAYITSFALKPAAAETEADTTVFNMDLGGRWMETANLSLASDETGRVSKLMFFGKTMTIDPEKWITVKVARSYEYGYIEAEASQGETSLSGTRTPSGAKISFNVNGDYAGALLDDITVADYEMDAPEPTPTIPVYAPPVPGEGEYYVQDFEGIYTDFDDWRTEYAYTVSDTQPLQIWGGSLVSGSVLSGALDIYPLAVTPRTGGYELTFDIKPNSAVFAGGTNWEGIVMQFNLGSSNADSWHDMKIGSSAGTSRSGEVNIDTLWLFGKEMTIDPEQWVTVDVIYDCAAGTITAAAEQGTSSVSGTAGFTNSTASVTGSPKVTFEALTVNSVKYDGVYLDNIVISDHAAPAPEADAEGRFYMQDFEEVPDDFDAWRKANAYTVSAAQPFQIWGGSLASDDGGQCVLSGAMDIYPLAVTPRTDKYKLRFDIKPKSATFAEGTNWEGIVMQFSLGSSNSDSWHDMKLGSSAGANQTGSVPIDTFWVFGNAMTIDPSQWINIEVVYDCESGMIDAKASQGDASVSGRAGFVNDTSSYTGSPKVIFSASTINNVKYEGVYLDNVIISEYQNNGSFGLRSWQLKDKTGAVIDSAAGQTGFDVVLDFDIGNEEEQDAFVVAAVYNNDGAVIKTSSFTGKLTAAENEAILNIGLNDPYSSDNDCRIFIWDSAEKMIPLCGAISIDNSVELIDIQDGVDIHNEVMRAYLNDSYENFSAYADGTAVKDMPAPVAFRWAYRDESGCEFVLEVSENEDMSAAKSFSTDKNYYNVYNLKTGTKYYWRVSAEYDGGKTYTSETSSFITNADAPRNIYALGVSNARDIGGWSADAGKKVKQGSVYRSYCFDYYDTSKNTDVVYIKADGIDTLVNDLGIKTEIDLRSESNKTSSVLGSGINYCLYGMNYDNDYLSNNKTAIKNVFETLADSNNYPVIYHCQAGADRTGAITYLLNGLLGVSKEDLLRDYLITNFSNQGGARDISKIADRYVKTLDEYEGGTLSEKIYNYLNREIGVSKDDLDFIIDYLTESAS